VYPNPQRTKSVSAAQPVRKAKAKSFARVSAIVVWCGCNASFRCGSKASTHGTHVATEFATQDQSFTLQQRLDKERRFDERG
jgi:hypothetical protein